MTVTVKVMAYIAIVPIWLVSMMHFNSKAMPTNDTDYSCHIKVVQLV